MGQLRYLTAGESHGQALVGILEGIVAGIEICSAEIDEFLQRRQRGYGRGARMKIEKDRVQILSGVRHGKTLGSPIAVMVRNLDWKNWRQRMNPEPQAGEVERLTIVRPGHADLAGALKYGHDDVRNVLERASARETAVRVALGAIAHKFLRCFGIRILSQVVQIGSVKSSESFLSITTASLSKDRHHLATIAAKIEKSKIGCLSETAEPEMIRLISQTMANQETVGGIFEVAAFFAPVGLGSHSHWDRRLDGRVASAMMSIPGIKSVEIGSGRDSATLAGSQLHDEIFYRQNYGIIRETNRAGGIEGGMSNGEPIVARCAMKPIPTLMKPLNSVNLEKLTNVMAHKERSDVCAVPAAAVVGEAVLSLVLADCFCEKFGGDSLEELKQNFENYTETTSRRLGHNRWS